MEPPEFIFPATLEPAAADLSQAPASIPPPHPEVVRKRGRPAKPKPGDQAINVPISADFREEWPLAPNPPTPPPSTTGEKRKRGRPFKVVSDVDNVGAPKTKLLAGVDRVKRSAGRPRKFSSASRPRGRPPKTLSRDANGSVLPTVEANGQLKGTVAIARKPAKRPSEKNDVPARRGPPLWMVDYGQVKSKLDNVQTRITNALGLLKSQLVNENVPSVATALQELEEITRMNVISAPFHAVQESLT